MIDYSLWWLLSWNSQPRRRCSYRWIQDLHTNRCHSHFRPTNSKLVFRRLWCYSHWLRHRMDRLVLVLVRSSEHLRLEGGRTYFRCHIHKHSKSMNMTILSLTWWYIRLRRRWLEFRLYWSATFGKDEWCINEGGKRTRDWLGTFVQAIAIARL